MADPEMYMGETFDRVRSLDAAKDAETSELIDAMVTPYMLPEWGRGVEKVRQELNRRRKIAADELNRRLPKTAVR